MRRILSRFSRFSLIPAALLTAATIAAVALAAGANPQFTFTTDEPGATWQCSLDGAPASACTSPQTYTSLPAGVHKVAVTSTFTIPAAPACATQPPGATATFGPSSYNRAGWDTFTKNAPVGSFASTSGTNVVYTGDQGMGWIEYADGWGANGVTPAYSPSTVQSVHDGTLDFNLHNDVGASISPIPGNRNQIYGAWSMCERVAPDANSPNGLGDFKQAVLLWPQLDSNGPAAESDYPEGNFNATSMGAFAHHNSTQDNFTTGTINTSQWHVYTQTWGPGTRSYYIDGRLIGTSTSSVWSQPERWQLQLQPDPGHTGGGSHGHVYVGWVWIGTPAGSSSSSSSTTTTSTTSSTTTTTTTTTPPPPGPIQHVVVIVMENNGAGILSSMPYLNGLANTYGKATSYYGIGHFSADNYIAMTSGTTCCFDDSFQNLSSRPNIFAQLGAQAQTLAERGGGGYAQRHDPGAYYGFTSQGYTDGQTVDLTGKKYTLVVPGLCDDMHDCGASTGDAWLSRNVPKFQANANTAIFITFDEDSGGGQGTTTPPANNVPMVVVLPAPQHLSDSTAFNHYSLLRTTENLLGLPCVASACSATSMSGHLGLP